MGDFEIGREVRTYARGRDHVEGNVGVRARGRFHLAGLDYPLPMEMLEKAYVLLYKTYQTTVYRCYYMMEKQGSR
ncbi:hypothetical protein KDH_75940 [Dictyobacter sp. S3.2.2.5]|uniref:Uncharacterized protein n=1 Tax=Dictyobacter halimunensis TaxID=3026934 RepID=A0ABQ6G421_9CHLR|nr:hypothetical protein KDH_75940 [Dictyobacter sp. S3.2.2.5]